MFGEVWSWAGSYRSGLPNIGVDPTEVPVAVRGLVDDAKYWFAADSPSEMDEAAVRLHHALVAIHPFPNGNGRHARFLTDLVLTVLEAPPFTWGRRDLGPISEVRARYVAALRRADRGDYEALAEFVRT